MSAEPYRLTPTREKELRTEAEFGLDMSPPDQRFVDLFAEIDSLRAEMFERGFEYAALAEAVMGVHKGQTINPVEALAVAKGLRAELAEAKAMALARFQPVPVTAADLAQAREFVEPYERGRLAGIEQAASVAEDKAREFPDFTDHRGTGCIVAAAAAIRVLAKKTADDSGFGILDAIRANVASSPASGSGGSPQTKWLTVAEIEAAKRSGEQGRG